MTSQQQLVCDSSTLANFKQWASAISAFFTTAGWLQSTDTGQVNWSTIASVPGAAAYVYEVWKPGDGLTAFFLKIEYGNVGTPAQPSIRLTISTSTNGAGTATGFIVGPTNTAASAITVPSTTTQFECNFSGDSGRMCVMLWRNISGGNNCQQMFCIERSLNAAGSYTSAYVTLWTLGQSGTVNASQRSLVFGVGAATNLPSNTASSVGGFAVRLAQAVNNNTNSASFNGSIPFDTCAPLVGYFDFPCTAVGVGAFADFADGVTFTAILYGSTRTYMAGKTGPFSFSPSNTVVQNTCLCMRYD